MQAGTAEEVRRSWWVSVLFGLIGIAFGLITLAKPFQALVAMAWAFGILALADGIASLLALFDKRVAIPKLLLLFYAVASIAFGVIAVSNPKATAGILFFMLSFWLIIAGIFRIVFAIRVRKEIVGEWLIALSGVLAIVLGIAFLLMVSLVLGAVVSALGKWWGDAFVGWEIAAQLINIVLGFALTTGVFAMIYKIMPRVQVRWYDVWIGAAATALSACASPRVASEQAELPAELFGVSYAVLAVAFVLEGISFLQALRQSRRDARESHRDLLDYVMGTSDPTLRAVFFEDPHVARQHEADIQLLERAVQSLLLAGGVLLVHETINQVKEPRMAWQYSAGQRRVRRAPQIAYMPPVPTASATPPRAPRAKRAACRSAPTRPPGPHGRRARHPRAAAAVGGAAHPAGQRARHALRVRAGVRCRRGG